MHIPVELYPAAYRSIINTSRGSGQAVATTFILVKPDVDALCAAKLLHDLLKADYVNNTIIPVRDWDEVDIVKERLVEEEVSPSAGGASRRWLVGRVFGVESEHLAELPIGSHSGRHWEG